MPKKITEKNVKGKKTTTSITTKKGETAKKNLESNKVVKEAVIETKTVESKKKGKKRVKGISRLKNNCSLLINRIMDNTPFAISLCIIIMLTAMLILTLCLKRIPKTKNGDEIIAKLNGKTITAEQLYQKLKESYGTDTLINQIDTFITDKEVTITDENKEYVQSVVDYYVSYAESNSLDLKTFLENYVGLSGISTEDEFYDFVLKDYKKTLAVQNFIGDNADEKELKEYYKENFSDKLTVKHILISIDEENKDTKAAEKEAYNAAVKLIQTLNKTNEKKLETTFDKLAKNNSDDTATYSNGGLIEDFSKKDVEEEFWNASYKLKNNEYTSEPIKTSYGYHIILKISSTPVEKYKDVIEEVKTGYASNLLTEDSTLQVSKWDELRKQYKLSINDDYIKETYETAIKNSKTEK